MAQLVELAGWLHVVPVVPSAVATVDVASSQLDVTCLERERRRALAIVVSLYDDLRRP